MSEVKIGVFQNTGEKEINLVILAGDTEVEFTLLPGSTFKVKTPKINSVDFKSGSDPVAGQELKIKKIG